MCVYVCNSTQHLIAKFLSEQYTQNAQRIKQFPVQFATDWSFWICIMKKMFLILQILD